MFDRDSRTRAGIAGVTAIAVATAMVVAVGAVRAGDAEISIVSEAVVPVAASQEARPAPATTVPATTVAPAPPVVIDRVVLVGDSLMHEASAPIGIMTQGKEIVPRYFGGTAPCDWLGADLEATPTTVVVISFTGNNYTECMMAPTGAKPAGQDVRDLIDRTTAADAWVVLVGQPRHAFAFSDEAVDAINATYREFAASRSRVVFVDAGREVETPEGNFAYRLPCNRFDAEHEAGCAVDGTTTVRGDGIHFCPVVDVHPCPVWSAGAFRFGAAIATAVNDPATFE
jgi:hypothetical protein